LGLDRWFLYHDLNYLLKVGMIRIGRLAGGRKDAYEDSSGRVRDGLFTRTQYLSDIADRSEIYLAGDGSVTESHWIRFERTLKELKQFLEKEGSRLLIVLIPDQIQVDHRLQADFFNASGRVAAQFEFERPQRLLRDWCETNRVSCVDLLPSFRASSDPAGLYIRNDLHWNVPGHALAAKEIFPSLLTEATSEAKSRRGAGHMKSASAEDGLCLRKSLTCG